MRKLVFSFICLLSAIPCAARIITVDDDGPADFNNIKAAVNDANDGDIIEVQPGTYTGNGNCNIDYFGKAITVRSKDPNDPNMVMSTVINCGHGSRGFYFNINKSEICSIEGLTITRGYGSKGGGIYCYLASPTIRNCVIKACIAANDGGGIYCGLSNPKIINCTISNNRSSNGRGGGIHCFISSPEITNCVISDNYLYDKGGGGISCCEGHISNCIIMNNSARSYGGGLYACSGPISSCIIINNSSKSGGGGLAICDGPITDCIISKNTTDFKGGGLRHCHGHISRSIISGNVAGKNLYGGDWYFGGGGLFACDGPITNCVIIGNSTLRSKGGGLLECTNSITNCIIRDNHPCESSIYECSTPVYSCLQGNTNGIGCISFDPCFAQPGYWDTNGTLDDVNDDFWVDGDYHLKSQAGRWDPNSQSWVQDEVTSPCIDAGDPASPIGLEPFPNGGRINMGAYGGTAQASKSYFGKPVCEVIVAGDINGDCEVNFKDFAFMAYHWLEDNNP